jgi:hypothetical protein
MAPIEQRHPRPGRLMPFRRPRHRGTALPSAITLHTSRPTTGLALFTHGGGASQPVSLESLEAAERCTSA